VRATSAAPDCFSFRVENSLSYPRFGFLRFKSVAGEVLPLTVVLLLLFAVGCGAGPRAGIPTATLSSDKTSIAAGSSATLSWSTTSATTISIDNGVGSVQATGQAQVTPAATTTYTLTATGAGGTTTVQTTITVVPVATLTITANPTSIKRGESTVLTVTATNAQSVTISNNVDTTTVTLPAAGGTATVKPTKTTIYTATATGQAGTPNATATATVNVNIGPTDITAINHVIFELQENRTFDAYFGMLNPYRAQNGFKSCADGPQYCVDGIETKLGQVSNRTDEYAACAAGDTACQTANTIGLFKLNSTCVEDMTSDWIASYGDVNRFDFSINRKMLMDGFVHTAENFGKGRLHADGTPFLDPTGSRAMGYYDQTFLNYYYYMASQFAVSDRWFSPVASKSTPNRIATLSGGTTQGYVYDPGAADDGITNVAQLTAPTIFSRLNAAGVSWKIYYSTTDTSGLPDTIFSYFKDSQPYLHRNSDGSLFIDANHIAPVSQFLTDAQAGKLPAFSFIEAGYGEDDEHPGYQQSILKGQQQIAQLVNGLMASPSWADSAFFFSYDEGGGPYDHVPPVPGHTNDFTDPSLGITSDISSIAVNPDSFNPCAATQKPPLPSTSHCDLKTAAVWNRSYDDPGVNPTDAAFQLGFGAQLGFRLPNMIISPFTKPGYVSHTPMDHTAVLRFVETRFNLTPLTSRDAAQPDLTEFFDFVNAPWLTPPTPPAPIDHGAVDPSCTPSAMQ
jgi:phospholipase C